MIKIKKSELFEAFKARKDYSAYKLGLNAGKKFEGRWRECTEHAERVLTWLEGVSGDELEVAEVQMTEDPTIAEELEPPEHEPPAELEPTEHEPTEEVAALAAEESAKAADDVCAMVQAAETGEPMPETNPEDIYMDEASTGLEVYIGPMPRPKQLPIIASDAIRKTYDELLAKEPNATLWMHRFRDDADHELVARLVTCACIRLSVSSAGHEKVCREINLRKIFEDGPMDEILGTITASRNNERVKLSLTREMVWDEFLLGESYHFSEGRTLCLTRTAVKHFRGIRSMWAYHHATHAAVVPCLECMNEAYSFIDGDRNLVCGNALHCGASSCAGIDEGARREKLRQRVKKFEILKDFSSNK